VIEIGPGFNRKRAIMSPVCQSPPILQGLDIPGSYGQQTRRTIAARLHLDAALFWTEARDLFEPTLLSLTGTPVIQFRNVSRARLVGLDFTATAAATPRLVATVSYQYLSARRLAGDGEADRALAFRPRHLLSMSADLSLPPSLTLGADVRYMSRFQRVELFPEDPRVSVAVLDLRLRHRRGPWAVTLLAANALNYIYNLAPRTLAPVRTLTATATWIH
jgi:iron complex outermembrane receptor protein